MQNCHISSNNTVSTSGQKGSLGQKFSPGWKWIFIRCKTVCEHSLMLNQCVSHGPLRCIMTLGLHFGKNLISPGEIPTSLQVFCMKTNETSSWAQGIRVNKLVNQYLHGWKSGYSHTNSKKMSTPHPTQGSPKHSLSTLITPTPQRIQHTKRVVANVNRFRNRLD
jgi:hypothetical protein